MAIFIGFMKKSWQVLCCGLKCLVQDELQGLMSLLICLRYDSLKEPSKNTQTAEGDLGRSSRDVVK